VTTETLLPGALGESGGQIAVEGRGALQNATMELIAQGRRSITILTPDLEPYLYDSSAIVAAVRGLVAGNSRQANIRILLFDAALARQGHGLVRLAQRLPTFIAIHRLLPEQPQPEFAFVTIDGAGYLYRHRAESTVGVADLCDRPRVKELEAQFLALWEQSEPEIECRRQPF